MNWKTYFYKFILYFINRNIFRDILKNEPTTSFRFNSKVEKLEFKIVKIILNGMTMINRIWIKSNKFPEWYFYWLRLIEFPIIDLQFVVNLRLVGSCSCYFCVVAIGSIGLADWYISSSFSIQRKFIWNRNVSEEFLSINLAALGHVACLVFYWIYQ